MNCRRFYLLSWFLKRKSVLKIFCLFICAIVFSVVVDVKYSCVCNHTVRDLELLSARKSRHSNETNSPFSRRHIILPEENIPDISEFRCNHRYLTQKIDDRQKEELVDLLESLIDLLKKHEINYFVGFGTLLGSFLFHDLLPWDDDIDIFIDIKYVNRFRMMFASEEVSTLFQVTSYLEVTNQYSDEVLLDVIPFNDITKCLFPDDHPAKSDNKSYRCFQQAKFSRRGVKRTYPYKWSYPFIDCVFFAANGSHFIKMDPNPSGRFLIPTISIYPLYRRPFNRLWVNAPRNPRSLLKHMYGSFFCYSSDFSHEEIKHNRQLQYLPCWEAKNCFASVCRRPITRRDSVPQALARSQWSIEELFLQGFVLQSVLVEEVYEGSFQLLI